MRFSDGLEFDLTGELRVERRKDGYYVVGRHMLCPVRDMADGLALISEILKGKES